MKSSFGNSLSSANRLRFGRDPKGAAAVEFALVAMPFFALLFAVLQTALIFFAGQVLESSVAEAARMIRTGQAQAQGFDQARFKQEVCNNIFGLISCGDSLNLDVRTYPSFDQVKVTKYEDGKFVEDYQYQPGVGGDIVVVRAFFEWPIVMPLMGVSQGDMANGNLMLASAIVFRNEPF
ncbi:MAG: TadE/TadG family type IV pilus assembly protein [Flavobacteriaceae bacterium]